MKYLTGPNLLIFVAAIFAAVGVLWAAYQQNKEKASQNQAKEKAAKSQQHADEGIQELLKRDELRPERLRLAYPLGFVIFEIDHSQRLIPYQKQLPEGYDIDLTDNVNFTDFPPDQIAITMPKFRIKDKGEQPFMILPNVTLPKRVGATNCINLIPRGNFEEAFSECAEILSVSDFGIVFLVGIKRLPLPSGYKPNTAANPLQSK